MSSKRLVDLDPFAAALDRKEREARENQRAETIVPHATVVNPATVAQQTTVAQQPTVVRKPTVARSKAEPLHDATVAQETRVVQRTTLAPRTIVETEYTSVPNDVWDEVMPTLNVYDQVVLWRLYRLARGHHSETCLVGLEKLAKYCNIGKRQVSTSVERLEKTGLIERLGADFGNKNKAARGTIYKINLPAARVAHSARVASKATVAQKTTLAQHASNKEHTIKESTQTQDPNSSVGVGSTFSLNECRKYAEHLRSTGQGITNPGGYATTIHRTGEVDELIKAFLNPLPVQKPADVSLCPDCSGSGWWYPKGKEMGIAKCKHERLAQAGEGK